MRWAGGIAAGLLCFAAAVGGRARAVRGRGCVPMMHLPFVGAAMVALLVLIVAIVILVSAAGAIGLAALVIVVATPIGLVLWAVASFNKWIGW